MKFNSEFCFRTKEIGFFFSRARVKKANFLVLANKSRERERERERENRETERAEREEKEREFEDERHTDRRDRDTTRERVKKNFFGPTFWSKNASKKPTPQTECDDLLGKFFSHTCDALLIKESI